VLVEGPVKPRFTTFAAACGAVLLTLATLPADAQAQRTATAHVRATPASAQRVAAGGGVRVASGSTQRVAVARVAPQSAVVVGGGYGGYGYRYGGYPYHGWYGGYPLYPSYGFGVSFGFGYGYPYVAPYGYYGYPGYPYYGYGYGGPYPYYYDGSASLRLQVSPRETEVFVDGYYAGVVDNFDGTFQRLNLEPGEHEVQLYLPGHRSLVQPLYLQPGKTTSIKKAMEPLAPGEAEPVKPTPEPDIRQSQPQPRQSPNSSATRRPSSPYSPGPPSRQQQNSDVSVSELPPDPTLAGYGSVALKVQPGPAAVTIDGERWEGAQQDEPLIVQLTAGQHVITIQKDGFRQYTTEVTVRSGRTATLNVALTKN